MASPEVLQSFTFNTHLERNQKLDINQDFLIVHSVQRDAFKTVVTRGQFRNQGDDDASLKLIK